MEKVLFKNTIWSLIDLGLYPLLMIIATPVFIKTLGMEQYGIWMVASTIAQFLNVFNFGMGDTTIRNVSAARALNNFDELSGKVNRMWTFAFFSTLACIILGSLIVFSGLIDIIFHIPETLIQTTHWALMLAVCATVVKFMEQVLLSVFKGFERFYMSARLSLLSRNSVILINIFIVLSGFSLPYVFLSSLIISVINIFIQLLVVKNNYPFLDFVPGKTIPSVDEFRLQFWYWLQSVIALLGFLSDRFVVGYFTNLKIVGLYSIATLIGSQIHNVFLALGAFLFPKVSLNKELDKNSEQLYLNARFAIAAGGWTLIAVLLLAGPFVFRLWLGETAYLGSHDFINLYLVFESFMLLIIVPYHFLNGSDHVKYNSLFESILRASHLIAMPIGFYLNGVEGLIWGMIVATIINLPFQYFVFQKIFFHRTSIVKSFLVLIPAFAFVGFVLFQDVYVRILALMAFAILLLIIYFKGTNLRFGK